MNPTHIFTEEFQDSYRETLEKVHWLSGLTIKQIHPGNTRSHIWTVTDVDQCGSLQYNNNK